MTPGRRNSIGKHNQWLHFPRDFPGIPNVCWDPGTHFIIAAKRGSRGYICKKFPKLLKRKKKKKKKNEEERKKERGFWLGYRSFYFWCLASLLLLGVRMRSLQGSDEPHQHPVGPSQSSVELGLLPTIRNKAVNLVGLKLIWSDYSVLPMKTKPPWHHMPCYMSLLNMSLSAFTALWSHFCIWHLRAFKSHRGS